jgi:nicotinate-nucleotide pyrophosphorylase (carboxylating)
LLDNMSPDEVRKAVEIIEGNAKVEVSGRIDLDTVGAYAETGADFISVGALTHSVRVFDIGLDIT